MSYHFNTIGIIGTGQLGTSLGLALKAVGPHLRLIGFDANDAHCQTARSMGAIDRCTESVGALARDCDLIILCTPLRTTHGLFEAIAANIGERAIITDVGSVKRPVMEDVAANYPSLTFVPGHPIAGTEKAGPEAGNPELFRNRKWILTPPKHTEDAATQAVHTGLEQIGAKVEIMDAALHDQMYATTSHLVQLVAYAFADCCRRNALEILPNTQNSHFYRFIRIGGSDARMWQDIFLINQKPLLDATLRFFSHMNQLTHRHTPDDDIRAMLDTVSQWRQEARTSIHKQEWQIAVPEHPHPTMDRFSVLMATVLCQTAMEVETITGTQVVPHLGAGFFGVTRPATLPADQLFSLIRHTDMERLQPAIDETMERFIEAVATREVSYLRTLIDHARETHDAQVQTLGVTP